MNIKITWYEVLSIYILSGVILIFHLNVTGYGYLSIIDNSSIILTFIFNIILVIVSSIYAIPLIILYNGLKTNK